MKTSTIVLLAALAGGLPALAQTAETPPPPQRGTPGVASSRGVVKVSDLADLTTGPRNADGAGGAGGAAPAAPPPEGASPAPAQSFLGTLYDPAVPDAIRAYPMGAVGPHHQVTGVYGKMLIRDRAGTLLRTVSFSNFWLPVAAGVDVFLGEHRLLYDPYADRWMIMAVTLAANPNPSVLLAVSQTDDPTGAWNLYRVRGDIPNEVYPDVPRIGFNKNWIVVSTGMYRQNDGFPVRFDSWAFNKTNAYAGGRGHVHALRLGR